MKENKAILELYVRKDGSTISVEYPSRSMADEAGKMTLRALPDYFEGYGITVVRE